MLTNEEQVAIYKDALASIELLTGEIEDAVDKPVCVAHGGRNTFRHHPKVRNSALLAYLKVLRGISLLNASLLLVQSGYGQEAAILCRIMDEAFEDIVFIGLADNENPSDKHRAFMQEFFQEELSNPDDPLSNIPRHRLPWKEKIASFKQKMEDRGQNYETFRKVALSMQRTFSGFVHGPYVFIMELFDPVSNRFITTGNKRPERIREHLDNFANYLYKTLNAVEITAAQMGKKNTALRAITLNLELSKTTGCLDQTGLDALAERRQKMYLSAPLPDAT